MQDRKQKFYVWFSCVNDLFLLLLTNLVNNYSKVKILRNLSSCDLKLRKLEMKGKLLFMLGLFLLAITDLKGHFGRPRAHIQNGRFPARGGQIAETFRHSVGYQLRAGQIAFYLLFC